ncbi:cyclic nucleotide-binding domain-containing protein [Parahaliea maris]|uniref:Cyclic nucleotide-binding domain-containing protein n=1 Tax=Parahaliea maris TaxID=2716870 RepID=A0A5C9A900_9GAMM|nr:cation:proton antiporter [Parahaliea maris]TXS96542.1 cyclic nucleotide-binding domain-containing protein [Parahaliea maris]
MEHTSNVIDLVMAVTFLLLVAAGVLAFSKWIKLPFTVLLVVIGIALSELAHLTPGYLSPLVEFHISPDVILFVFLPTLIFESSLHLEARELRRNLLPVLTLAVPGLLVSTVIIGSVVSLLTPIDFSAALVLGAILSATDPVAVISLFKQLGAPRRLTILVEGESLFNDATAIVASQILLAIAVAGYVSTQTIVAGVGDFFFVFFGGALVGWLMALVTGFFLGHVEGDPLIEISLTTILAYFSFLIAEHTLHVSGVMATVAAALTIGGWGRSKISHSVSEYLENFWEYLAFVANALIFLLVGLQIDLAAVAQSWSMLVWVIMAMLLARAVVIFAFVPLVGKLPGAEVIDRKFQAVMYWGGLRGAIALAIALSLGDFRHAETFVVLVTGAVLFTLIVPGLTIERLIKVLGLNRPPLADRMALAEAHLNAQHKALSNLPALQQEIDFSPRIAAALEARYQLAVDDAEARYESLREAELDLEQECDLLMLRCFSVQKALYHQMFAHGHLSEKTYRNMVYSLNVEGDSLRYHGALPHIPPRSYLERWSRNTWMRFIQRAGFGLFDNYAESIRSHSTARDYELAWAGYHGCLRVLANIDELSQFSHTRSAAVDEVRSKFQRWSEGARRKIDAVVEQFPEFFNASQQRLAERTMLHSQRNFIVTQRRSGAIPNSVASALLEELDEQIRDLRGYDTTHLKIDANELLRKVPVFADLPEEEVPRILACLTQRTVPARQDIIQEGAFDESLYLIARGSVRVLRRDEAGREIELAVLAAGDFVGESGFLTGEARSATCRALTPCAIYELKRRDLNTFLETCPGLQVALERAMRHRTGDVCMLEDGPGTVPG